MHFLKSFSIKAFLILASLQGTLEYLKQRSYLSLLSVIFLLLLSNIAFAGASTTKAILERCSDILIDGPSDTPTLRIKKFEYWNRTFPFSAGFEVNAGRMSPCLTAIVVKEGTGEGYVHHFFMQELRDFERFISNIKELEKEIYGRTFEPATFRVYISGRAQMADIFDLRKPGELNSFFERSGFLKEHVLVRLLPKNRGGELILNRNGVIELVANDASYNSTRMPINEWPYSKRSLRVQVKRPTSSMH